MLVALVVNLNFRLPFFPSAMYWPLSHSSKITASTPPGESRIMTKVFGNSAVSFSVVIENIIGKTLQHLGSGCHVNNGLEA